MEHAKKFALIPEEALSRHVLSKKQMSEFDTAMSKILNSTLPDHEKVRQYYEILKRKMDLQEFNIPLLSKPKEDEEPSKKEPIKQVTLPEPETEEDFSLILSSVPSRMKRQAQTLINFLKKHPRKFRWDKNLAVSYEGKSIPESNIADLFHLLFSVNKKTPIKAQSELLQTLQEMHVPQNLIKNKHLSTKNISSKPAKKKKVDRNVMIWENY